MESRMSSSGEFQPLGRGRVGWVAALLLGVVAGGVGLALVVASRMPERSWWNQVLGRETRLDVSQPTVVDRIQQRERLETVVYTMDKIVSREKGSAILPDFLAGDRLLMLVHG